MSQSVPISGIYSITNTANGKVYIGSASNFPARWRSHRNPLNKGNHSNSYLQRAWNKYGESAFVFKILLYCNPEFLAQWEQIAIDGHKNTVGWKMMYNLSLTAGSNFGITFSEATRENMRRGQANRKPPTEEAKAKMSLARKGVKMTEEQRLAHVGVKKSPEGAANIKEASRKRFESQMPTEETKVKMSKSMVLHYQAHPCRTGFSHSEKTKAKMRDAQQARRSKESWESWEKRNGGGL